MGGEDPELRPEHLGHRRGPTNRQGSPWGDPSVPTKIRLRAGRSSPAPGRLLRLCRTSRLSPLPTGTSYTTGGGAGYYQDDASRRAVTVIAGWLAPPNSPFSGLLCCHHVHIAVTSHGQPVRERDALELSALARREADSDGG